MIKSSKLSHLQYTYKSHEYIPCRSLLLRQPLGLRAVGFRLPHHDSFTSANCNTSSIHHICLSSWSRVLRSTRIAPVEVASGHGRCLRGFFLDLQWPYSGSPAAPGWVWQLVSSTLQGTHTSPSSFSSLQETADVTHSEDYLVLTSLKITALRGLLCASSLLGKLIQALDIWVHISL